MNSSTLLALRRRRLLLIVVPLLAGIAVFLLSPKTSTATHYRSSEAVTLDPSKKAGAAGLAQAALLVKQPVVSGAAAANYGAGAPAAFSARIRTAVDDDAYTITFSASGTNRTEIERYVDAYADAFVTVLNKRTTNAFSDQIQEATGTRDLAQLALNQFLDKNAVALAATEPDPELSQRRQQLADALGEADQHLNTVTQQASSSSGGYSAVGVVPASAAPAGTLSILKQPAARGPLAALLALAGMVAVVAAVDRISPRIVTREQVEEVVGVPVMAMVPVVRSRKAGLVRVDRSSFVGSLAEAHRTLRVHLQFLMAAANDGDGEAKASTVAVVSATPGDGKSTTTSMLAMAYVEAMSETLVLGCDFRRPSIQLRFGLKLSPGFTDRRNEGIPNIGGLIQRDPETGVRVLSSGRPTTRTAEVLPDVRGIIQAARAVGQQVIIDTAPVLVASETAQIAAMVDQVVMVVRAGQTSVRALREAVSTLRLNATPLVGVVMIGSPESADYSYYYDAYYIEAERRQAAQAAGRDASG